MLEIVTKLSIFKSNLIAIGRVSAHRIAVQTVETLSSIIVNDVCERARWSSLSRDTRTNIFRSSIIIGWKRTFNRCVIDDDPHFYIASAEIAPTSIDLRIFPDIYRSLISCERGHWCLLNSLSVVIRRNETGICVTWLSMITIRNIWRWGKIW